MINALIVGSVIAGFVALILVVEECVHRFEEHRQRSMHRPIRRSLYLDNRRSDPQPEMLPLNISKVAQFVGAFCRRDPDKFAVLPDQQIRRVPDVEVGNH